MLKVCRIGVCNNSLLPAAWATSVMWRIGNRFRASLWQDKWAQTGNMNISPFLPTIGKRLAQRYALGLTCQLFDICSIYRFSSHLQPSPVCSDYRKAGLYGKHQQMPLSSGSWLALASGAPVKRSGSGKRMKEWNFSPALPAHSSVSRGCSSPGCRLLGSQLSGGSLSYHSTFRLRPEGGKTLSLVLTSGCFSISPWFCLALLPSF